MSLEETLSALVDAVSANTDALQHLAAAIRGNGITTVVPKAVDNSALPAPEKAVDKSVEKSEKAAPVKSRASKKVDAPAAPLDLSVAASTPSATPASAPAAASGSEAKAEGTYADLQVLVPELAEKKGRSAAMGIFAELGFPNGKEMAAKAPQLIPEAVKMFRKALA
jgi:hypothetical protein